jgi:multiple sugar transport system substrate-binding protein
MTVLAPQIQAALKGDKSPRQALDDAAKEADALVARAR